jgi:hAT family C-terminal dimerisation region
MAAPALGAAAQPPAPLPAPSPTVEKPAAYAVDKTTGRHRLPVFKKNNAGENTAAVDHWATYADMVADGKCKNCMLHTLHPSEINNRKQHFASCAYHELTKEDQANPTLLSLHTGRAGRKAASASAGQARLSFPSGLPPVKVKEELVAFVAGNGGAFRQVEHPAFRSLFKALRPDLAANLVGRRTIARAMPAMLAAVLKAIEDMLVTATGDANFVRDVELVFAQRGEHVPVRDRAARVLFSITLDGWSNVALKPYLGITLHFIDKSFKMHKYTIYLGAFEHPHKGERIIEAVDWALAQVGAQTKHMVGFTTDNGSNMLSAAKTVDILNFLCSCHTLHLALAGSIASKPGVELFGVVWDIIAHFARSSARRQALKRACKNRGVPELMVIFCVVTRWSSCYYALERYLKLESPIRSLSADDLGLKDDAKSNAATNWMTLKKKAVFLFDALLSAEKVLKKVQDVNLRLQGSDKPTIGLVLDSWAELIDITTYDKEVHDEGIKAWLAVLNKDIQERAANIAPHGAVRTQYLQLARFLDPTTGHAKDMNAKPKPEAPAEPAPVKKIKSKRQRLSVAQQLAPSDSAAALAEFREVKTFAEDLVVLTQYGVAQRQQDKTTGGLLEDASVSAGVLLNGEFGEFAKLVREQDVPTDCLGWWSTVSDLPMLKNLARSIFSIQASSAQAERVFSLAGLVMGPLRNRLGDAGAAQIICADGARQGLNLRDLYAASETAAAIEKAAAKAAKVAAKAAAMTVAHAAGQSLPAGHADEDSDGGGGGGKRVRAEDDAEGEAVTFTEVDYDDVGEAHAALIDAGVLTVDATGLLVEASTAATSTGDAEAATADDDGMYPIPDDKVDHPAGKMGPQIQARRSKRALQPRGGGAC